MNTYREIQVLTDSSYLFTNNLLPVIGYEIKVLDQENSQECLNFLKYFIDYCLDYKLRITPEQTIAYHSWLVQLCHSSDSLLSVWEAKSDGDGFKEGISYASKVIKEQVKMCNKFDVSPGFPQFSQNIVISKGVYEGLGIDAVRYASPEHMTGWWLTTDLYDDNVDSLMNVHYFHVAFNRPDLLKYLALPNGFRFYITDSEEDIWFDEDALD
ncbi:hypothetical protein [Paenibacillus thiaminolyticus]|uniref:Imm33-like domain-containing protein n=1 Tax=Paenibacillus thiaminolyticus TaxID=49283 RepID=A0A3A3GT62_PANTH|nr:hypothetical protein [Paenibacillus thiaminolyticus]RJG26979.1 hypothetical protein DQX05_02945 [Paenibacillus thiaminolyticus]